MNKQSKIPAYALDIIEEYPHLHIIAFTKDKLLAYSENTGKAHFFYTTGSEGMSFHFNLISEVTDKYAAWFLGIIKSLHYELGNKETANDYYNTLIKI